MDQFMDINLYINFGMNLCAVVISIYLLIAALVGGGLNKKVNQYFFLMVLFNLIGSTSNLALGILVNFAEQTSKAAFYILDYIGFTAPGIQVFMFSLYLYEYLKKKSTMSRKLIYIAGTFCISHIILIAAALLTDSIVYFENGIYTPNKLFWVWFIFPALSFFTCMIVTLKYRKTLNTKEWLAIELYLLIPIVFNTLDMFYTDIYFGYFVSTFSMFIVYIAIQAELKWQIEKKETELTQNRIAIMLSQINPHFLYNSLNAISELCYENPEAHKALLSFASYLRTNMDSLTERNLILFEHELKHVEHYLYLEKLRFQNRLTIVYDIQTTDFMLPTLTLQPIVENAVRHGVSQKLEGGTVTIRTKECKDNYVIQVLDDGVGFHTEEPPSGDSSHIGLLNVKERISSMCNGNSIIESIIDQGTVVTIELPKGEHLNENYRSR